MTPVGHSCPETGSAPNAHDSSKTLKKLYLAIGLCFIFMCIEIIGGWWANSLAIISDAVHLLSDVAGFLTSVVAIIVSRRAASATFTFGFQRAQTLGAFASIAMVWIMTAFLVWEAVERIKVPEEIDGRVMFITAAFGLLINLILAFSLGHTHSHCGEQNHSEQHKDINLRAAFIHVIGDLIQSIGVLIASGLIWYRPEWRIADPICTFMFSILVLGTTLIIFRDILRILMEATPKGIKTEAVSEDIKAFPGVVSVHDLHIWTLSPGNIALTVHVIAEKEAVSGDLLHRIGEMICSKHGIHHSTIQIEQQEGFHCKPVFCTPREESSQILRTAPVTLAV